MTTTPVDTEISGVRKAAIMLVQMGKDQSARIMAQLRDTEVEEITAEIMRLGHIDGITADGVLDEFTTMVRANRYLHQGGMAFAREVLEATLGRDAAEVLVARLSAAAQDVPFGFLQS
ncbi:MAG: flagellar motor switch protein FliG, partial [Micromonosporaceae bacterium]|nr:flagellar motor switch protein FliG [Micromonosporaceae bacterium]